jgi:hypothetical protein
MGDVEAGKLSIRVYLEADHMATLHAELSNFTARELKDLQQSAPASSGTAIPVESKLGVSDAPGDFYWYEDTPAVPLWRGALAAFRHMLGMKI